MIFDDKSINEITDDEIRALVVDHVAERQHLEFKKTINYSDDDDKIEILHDITSLTNGGGGYIIIGIRDDGKGRAQRFEPNPAEYTTKMKKAVISLCLDHIRERIEGLEVIERKVDENSLVMIRVPESARKPHMVTYQNRTDFYTRYQDGKRAMTIGEVREFFNKDHFGMKLSSIETRLDKIVTINEREYERQRIMEKIKKGRFPELVTIRNSDTLSDVAYQRFLSEVEAEPFFRIAITPVNLDRNSIDLDSKEISQLLMKPPGSRPNGWNMAAFSGPPKRVEFVIFQGEMGGYRYLEILSNGHMEFWTPLDEHFCWRQSPEEFRTRPRLYPYPVNEYPTTFLRLYRGLINAVNVIKDDFELSLHYRNVKGYILRPYSPESVGFMMPSPGVHSYQKEHFEIFSRLVPNDFEPDTTAFEIVSDLYDGFGLSTDTIPFYDETKAQYVFPS
jgi:hypothetical protein